MSIGGSCCSNDKCCREFYVVRLDDLSFKFLNFVLRYI